MVTLYTIKGCCYNFIPCCRHKYHLHQSPNFSNPWFFKNPDNSDQNNKYWCTPRFSFHFYCWIKQNVKIELLRDTGWLPYKTGTPTPTPPPPKVKHIVDPNGCWISLTLNKVDRSLTRTFCSTLCFLLKNIFWYSS